MFIKVVGKKINFPETPTYTPASIPTNLTTLLILPQF